jgi:hypothetical protein
MDKIDMILIMSVNPGFGGQSFIPEALKKIADARRLIDESGRDILLEVDGGIKIDNIAAAAAAGADTFVAGSAIFGKPDYKAVIDAMRAELATVGKVMPACWRRARRHHRPRRHHARHVPDFPRRDQRHARRTGPGADHAGADRPDGRQGFGKPDPLRLALDWDAGRIETVFAQAMDAYQRHYLAINGKHSALYPDVIEGLTALKAQGLRLACVTNKPIAFTTPLLEAQGAGRFLRGGLRRRFAAAQEARSAAAAAGVRGFRPGAGPGGGHRRLLERRRSGARGRLSGADRALWLQPRTGYTRNRFRWYSIHAARSGTPDPFA